MENKNEKLPETAEPLLAGSLAQNPSSSHPNEDRVEDERIDDGATLLYLRSVGYRPLFSRQLEAQLVEQAQVGNLDSASRLIESHLRLIVSISRTYLHSGIRLVDLVNAGKQGFTTALHNWRRDKSARFLSYATWHIRKAIEKQIDNLPEVEDAAEAMLYGDELPRIQDAEHVIADGATSYYSRLEAAINGVIGESLAELMGSGWGQKIERKLEEWLEQLPPAQQDLLRSQFGLRDHQLRSLHDISEESGAPLSQLREIQTQALNRLKGVVRNYGRFNE